MKKGTLLIFAGIISFGLTAFSFINRPGVTVTSCQPPSDPMQWVTKWKVPNPSKVALPVTVGLGYYVRARYTHPITKNTLQNATTLKDLIPSYPDKWINEYISVELSSTVNSKKISVKGRNYILTTDQINLIQNMDWLKDLEITVKYRTANIITKQLDESTLRMVLSLAPEIDAAYIGGMGKLIRYLETNSSPEIKTLLQDPVLGSAIFFTINEKGVPQNIELPIKSANKQLDEHMLNLIRKMPNWIPAQNENGEFVTQNFQFQYGVRNGC